jgi:hypothetical protein
MELALAPEFVITCSNSLLRKAAASVSRRGRRVLAMLKLDRADRGLVLEDMTGFSTVIQSLLDVQYDSDQH